MLDSQSHLNLNYLVNHIKPIVTYTNQPTMPKYTIYQIINATATKCLIDATTNPTLTEELKRHSMDGSITSLYEMETDCITDVHIAIAFYQHRFNIGQYLIVGVKRCPDNSWIAPASYEFQEPNDDCIDWIYNKNNKKRKVSPNVTKVN